MLHGDQVNENNAGGESPREPNEMEDKKMTRIEQQIAIYEDERNFLERCLISQKKYLNETTNRGMRNSIMQTIKTSEERLEKMNRRLRALAKMQNQNG